jgi:hypothetical protein
MNPFQPNRGFRRQYKKLFKRDPQAANVFLLLCELANKKGQVKADPEELKRLMGVRFEDPKGYQL